MALAALLKTAGISMDDIQAAKQQAQLVRQFIEATNQNTVAIGNRLAAIDTGVANLRDMQTRADSMLAAAIQRLDSLARGLEALSQREDLNDPER